MRPEPPIRVHIDRVKSPDLLPFFQDLTLIIHKKGWPRLTLRDISLAMVKVSGQGLFLKSKDDLLTFLIETAEQTLFLLEGDLSAQTAVRDILLEGTMSLLDGLLPFKDFLRAIFLNHPESAISRQLLFRLEEAMQAILEMAHVKTSFLKGALRIKALTFIFMSVFKVWLQDDSPGQEQVLALLDGRLAQAEAWAGYFGV